MTFLNGLFLCPTDIALKREEENTMVEIFQSFGLEIVVGMIFSVLGFLFIRVAYYSWIKKTDSE